MNPLAEDQFRLALGVRRELRFLITPPGEASFEVSLDSPCAVVGRGADAQLLIPRPTIAFRHAYVQAIGNRVCVADLFGANSIAWDDNHDSGWASPSRGFRVGDCQVQLLDDGWEHVDLSLPSPFDHKLRDDSGHEYGVFPEVELQVLNRSLDGVRWPINRVITLVGRDDRCRIACNDQSVSKVHCSLVLTPSGLWVVDLLGKGGTRVDDVNAHVAPLRHGNVLQVGRFQMQARYLSPPAVLPPSKADHVGFLTRLHRIFAVTWDGDTLIVTPQGRARDFRYQDIQLEANCIIQILKTQSFRNVLVDFHLVRLSGSLIIDALTQFCRAARGLAAICECSPEQLSSLQDMNLLSLWPHYATRAEAVRVLRTVGAASPRTSDRPVRTAHVITRLIIGGAQENTLWTVHDQHHLHGDEVTLITGPGVGPEGSLEETARSQGLDLRIVPELGRSIHPGRDFASFRALVRTLREYRPDIVHTHSSKAGILGRMAAAKLRIPCVHTIHGASFHYGQRALAYRAYVAAEKFTARWTRRYISVSDEMTAQYVSAGIAEAERFTTIYSGFDVEPFLQSPRPPEEVRRELGLEPRHIVAGKIARLFHLKGHEFLVAAAPALCERSPDLRFLLVGEGVLRAQLEREIGRLGLADRFVFTGLVPPQRIPELMAAMDIVVHTSQWEGLARVLPQGLIAGKPVVSYDVGGAREVVIPDETGFLLPRDSVAELADAVSALAADPSLRQRLGATGRSRFTERFRHETMTRRIREVYAAVLG